MVKEGFLMAATPTKPAPKSSHSDDPPLAVTPPEDRVITIGEEQIRRSAEIEAMGVAKWVEAHDGRTPDGLKQVPGVK
jgi:hypothetical protein